MDSARLVLALAAAIVGAGVPVSNRDVRATTRCGITLATIKMLAKKALARV